MNAKRFKVKDWAYVTKPGHAWFGQYVQIVNEDYDPFSHLREFGVVLGIAKMYIGEEHLSWESPGYPGHEGHEIIENHAGGKTFFYCRKCRIEVP